MTGATIHTIPNPLALLHTSYMCKHTYAPTLHMKLPMATYTEAIHSATMSLKRENMNV